MEPGHEKNVKCSETCCRSVRLFGSSQRAEENANYADGGSRQSLALGQQQSTLPTFWKSKKKKMNDDHHPPLNIFPFFTFFIFCSPLFVCAGK